MFLDSAVALYRVDDMKSSKLNKVLGRHLLQSWHAQYHSQTEKHCLDDNENVYFADEIYRDRLARIPSIIPLDYNPIVRNCISLYADRRRDLVRYMMGMADLYFPIFEQILDQYDLPLELKYLAVVESSIDHARFEQRIHFGEGR